MRIIPVAEVKARLSRYLQVCRNEAVVITRSGRPAAMLLPIRDEDDLERLLLAHSPIFQRIIQASRERVASTGGGGLKADAFWKAVDRVKKPQAAPGRRKRRG